MAGEIEDRELLNRFANEHSEEAFAELVRRHMGRVHSVALRQVADDTASAADIGARLGMSENAARMRVERALEKLRTRLARRGVTSTSSVLASTLAGASTSVAPPGLATAVTSTVLASGFTSPFTFTLLTVMASSPVKIVIAVIAVGMVGGVLIHQHNTTERLQSEKAALEQRVAELTSLADSYRLAAEKNSEALAQGARQSAEVLRLRGEVSQLRRQTVPKPAAKAASAKPPEPVEQPTSEEEARAFGLRRMNESKTLLLGLILYASEHDDQFPATLDAAAEHLKSSGTATGMDETLKNLNLNDFEMIHQGSLTNLANPAMGIVLREREAWRTPEGKWARAYGFGDGHSELHLSDTPDDADWEAAHTVVHQDAPKGGF